MAHALGQTGSKDSFWQLPSCEISGKVGSSEGGREKEGKGAAPKDAAAEPEAEQSHKSRIDFRQEQGNEVEIEVEIEEEVIIRFRTHLLDFSKSMNQSVFQ